MTSIDLERLVIFDLETTGLEADCKIVQIAMIRGERIFQTLVNPGRPIPPESTEIHRITDQDVAEAPFFKDILGDVLNFVEGGVLSGFNIRRFDVPVLRREVKAADGTFPALPILDLFELNQKMNPRSLSWFYHQYVGEAMDQDEAHDAVYDCVCTLKGFLGMFKKHEELPTDLIELVRFSEPDQVSIAGSQWFAWTEAHCEPCFTRGKYKGWALSEVHRKEPSYLSWLSSIDADSAAKNIVNLFRTNKEAYVNFLLEEHPLRLEPRYLEFRQAMDQGDRSKLIELIELARQTKDASLLFLAAAWCCQAKQKDAKELALAYLHVEDKNHHKDRRRNFLKKSLQL